jgi:ribonuclease I
MLDVWMGEIAYIYAVIHRWDTAYCSVNRATLSHQQNNTLQILCAENLWCFSVHGLDNQASLKFT